MCFDDYEKAMETRRLELHMHLLAVERGVRPQVPPNEDVNSSLAALIHRANGGAIYVLPDQLVEEFDKTDCDEIRMSDIKLPFPTSFVKFTPPQALFLVEGARVDGCYITKQGDEFLLILTSRWEGVDYTRSLSIACLDPTFRLHLPAPQLTLGQPGKDTDICVNAAVELGIEQFLAENAPPTEDFSQTIERRDGTTTYFEDARAHNRQRRIAVFRSQEPVFRACLNIIVNAACFISFRPEDIAEDWAGKPPEWVIQAINDQAGTRRSRDRQRDAWRNIATGDYTRIKICGKDLFHDSPKEVESDQGTSPRAHWRRGHWRRQRHGAGLSLVTPRWIRPTIVMKDNGPLVETRIYDVPASRTSGEQL